MSCPIDPSHSSDEAADLESLRSEFSGYLTACHVDVLMYAFSLVHNMADAEDICQRVAVILWQKFDQYERGTNFKHWALTTAKLVAMNTIRRRQRDRLVFSDEVVRLVADAAYREAINAADKQDRWQKIASCISKLPTRQQELLRFFYGERLTASEIASRVGKTEKAVSSALSRSRIQIRSCVKRILRIEAAQ